MGGKYRGIIDCGREIWGNEIWEGNRGIKYVREIQGNKMWERNTGE